MGGRKDDFGMDSLKFSRFLDERTSIGRMLKPRKLPRKDVQEMIKEWKIYQRIYERILPVIDQHIFSSESDCFVKKIVELVYKEILKEIDYSQKIVLSFRNLALRLKQISEFLAGVLGKYYGLEALNFSYIQEVKEVIEFILLSNFLNKEVFVSKMREVVPYLSCAFRKEYDINRDTILTQIKEIVARRNKCRKPSLTPSQKTRQNEQDYITRDSSDLSNERKTSPDQKNKEKNSSAISSPSDIYRIRKTLSLNIMDDSLSYKSGSSAGFQMINKAKKKEKKMSMYKKMKAKFLPQGKEGKCPLNLFSFLSRMDDILRGMEMEQADDLILGYFDLFFNEIIQQMFAVHLVFESAVIEREMPIFHTVRTNIIDKKMLMDPGCKFR